MKTNTKQITIAVIDFFRRATIALFKLLWVVGTIIAKTLQTIARLYISSLKKHTKDTVYITLIVALIMGILIPRALASNEIVVNSTLQEKQQTMQVSIQTMQDVNKLGKQADPEEVIDEYLKRKGSPMAGVGKTAIATADKYNLPRYLLIAIAGHESKFAELGYAKTLEAKGKHNAWGLGIHQGWAFDTWEQAFDKCGEVLRKYYFDEGRTTPETIEDKWAPGIENSYGYEWSAGVNKYGAELVALEAEMSK